MKKTILITGATSGFGEATAKLLAPQYKLIITGRRTERLESLKAELQKEYQADILPLTFDVRNRESVQQAINSLPDEWQHISVLVNNAGLALGKASIDHGDFRDWDQMIDTNVKGILYVTEACLPFLKKQQNAHIVNVGSIAGTEVYESGNVYCASKHAVNALSKAMRIDLLPHQIRVTQIRPGLAETEFSEVRYKGDKEKAKSVYDGLIPLFGEDIASTIKYALETKPHVCLNDIEITCTAQANATNVYKK